GIAMAGTGLMVTQFLQNVLGHSPLASALLFAPMGLGVAAGTMTAPALARRMQQTTAIAGGLAGCAARGPARGPAGAGRGAGGGPAGRGGPAGPAPWR